MTPTTKFIQKDNKKIGGKNTKTVKNRATKL